jgi:UDP-N-acetylmuramoylalanine--D-glutamate ligase
VSTWEGKRAVVIGLARQGKALARYLVGQGAQVTLSDIKPADELRTEMDELADLYLEYELGGHPETLLKGCDVLFLSGGVPADLPLVLAARQQSIPVANDAQIFLEACPAQVIGITGSAGKTTTTSLAARMASVAFADTSRVVWLGGNIGRPLLVDLENIKDADLVVMELSSFQLELMSDSPQIAAILNFTPDHLDRHHTLQAYAGAKQRILEHQGAGDWAVLGHSDPQVWSWRDLVKGRLASFGASDIGLENSAFLHEGALTLRIGGRVERICAAEEVRLRGQHNLLNILAACMLCALAGVDTWAMEQVARTFEGVPHRLEFVREVNGASWYNDSIATTPGRTLAAVRAFDEPIILLLGGHDKDLPWRDFLEQAIPRVERLVVFGEAGPKIEAVARAVDADVALERTSGLEQAVQLAARAARSGMVILLSPGCTSFDEFSDYEERGERFREWVRAL